MEMSHFAVILLDETLSVHSWMRPEDVPLWTLTVEEHFL